MKKYRILNKILAIISLISLFLQPTYPVILAAEESCTLSVDRPAVSQGEYVTFTLTAGFYGFSAYWGGSNNGQPIGGNYPLDGFSNTNSWQGTYRQDTTGVFSRYVEILNEEGSIICTTNTLTVNVEPQIEPPTQTSPSQTPDPWDDYSGGIDFGQTQAPDTPSELAFETPNIHYEGDPCEPSVACSVSVPNAEDSSKPLYCRSIGQDSYHWVTRDYANSRCDENNINLTAFCSDQTFYCNGTTWTSQPTQTSPSPSPSEEEPAASPLPTAEPSTALSLPVITSPTSQETAQEIEEGLAMSYARKRLLSFATDRQQAEEGSQNNLAYTIDQTTEAVGGVVGNTAGQINSTIQNFGIGSPSPPPSNITCSLKAEPPTIEAGGQVSYTIDSSSYGYSAFWKGSENGQPIDYQVENFQNTNYWTKTYTHHTPGTLNYSVEILNEAGERLCTTNPVEIRVTEKTTQPTTEDSLRNQQILDRFNGANKDLGIGITVSGDLTNPTFSVTTTATYVTTATSGSQFLFSTPKEEQKKFFTESKKRVDNTVFTTANLFFANIPEILVNQAADIVDQYSLTTAVCQKAGVDVLFDPSYREQITGSIRLKGKTGLDFKQWQDFAKAINPSAANPFSEEQIEEGRQKTSEAIKERLASQSFAYQSKLDEVNGMNEEQARQGCTQAFEEFISHQKELETELQSTQIMLLAGGPMETLQTAGLKAVAPKAKEVGRAIGGQLKSFISQPIRNVASQVTKTTGNLLNGIRNRILGGKEEAGSSKITGEAKYVATVPEGARIPGIEVEPNVNWGQINPEVRKQALRTAQQLGEDVDEKMLLLIAQELQSGLSEKDVAASYSTARSFIDTLKRFFGSSGKLSPAATKALAAELNQQYPGVMTSLAFESGVDGKALVGSLATTESSGIRGAIETLFPAIFTTAAARKANFQKIAPALVDTVEAFSALRFFCLRYLPRSGPSFCDQQPEKLFSANKIHIISQKAMDRLCGKGAAGCAPGDRVYVVGQVLDTPSPVMEGRHALIHECTHKYCQFMNRDAYYAASILFPPQPYNITGLDVGQRLVFQPAQFFYEGLTEYTTQQAMYLSGKVPQGVAYPNAVMFIDQQIIPLIMKNSNRSREEATAVVVEAALGNFDNLYAEVGGGNGERGVRLLREMLPNVAQESAIANPQEAQEIMALARRLELIRRLFLLGIGGSSLVGAGAAANSILFNNASSDQNLPSQPEPGSLLPTNIIKYAYAQEKESDNIKLVSLNKYEYLARQEAIKRFLTTNQNITFLTLTDIINQEFAQEAVVKTSAGYIFTSGRTGMVRGEMEQGSYLVGIKPIPGFNIKVPGIIEVKAGQETVIPVAIKKGTGKVEKTAPPTGWRGLLNKLFGTVFAQEKQESPVQLVVFSDTNNNGKINKDEQVLPWAGLKVELKKVNQDRTLPLTAGWNLVAWEVLPQKPLNASTLLGEIARQGGYATTVSVLENGAWKSFVVRGDKTYSGDDFPITLGKAYFVKALKSSVFVYQGQELVAPIKLKLASGWNGVGIPYSQKTYSAGQLLDTLNSSKAAADTTSRWESGLWDTFVKQGTESFGENFPLVQARGYLLKIGKGLEFSP